VWLGALHQAGAILVLTATLLALYLVRHEPRRSAA
jgi:heme A synthase